jgi:hypothetical protein
MKTVIMNKTVVCENASGVNQVFGPKGKQFCVDSGTASRLQDMDAIDLVKVIPALGGD